MKKLAMSVVAVCLILSPSVRATTVIPMSFEQLVAESEIIFRGVVVDARSRLVDGTERPLIVTDVSFRSLNVLKGNPSAIVVLSFLGGTVGDQWLHVSDMPQFSVGDRDVVFASPSRREVSPIVGFMQGRFRIVTDPASGAEAVRRFDHVAFSSIAQLGASAKLSTAEVAPMSVDAFQRAISSEIARQNGGVR
jgi:hypothetical protein